MLGLAHGYAAQQQAGTDAEGDAYKVILTGPGSFVLDPAGGNGAINSITLTGTTAASTLAIAVTPAPTGSDGRVGIGQIGGSGSLRSLSAAKADLTGAGINFTGGVGAITLANIGNGSAITTGSDARVRATALTAKTIGACTVSTGAASVSVTAGSVAGAKIAAANVTSFKVTGGDAVADVIATGKLISFSVAGGDFSGHVAADTIGSVRIAKSRAGAGGSLVDSYIAARSIGPVIVDGDMVDSYVMAGASLGANHEPGGTGPDADTYGPGALKSVIVKGNVSGSVIGAGLSPVDTHFGDPNDGVLGGKASRLTSFTVGGTLTSSVIGAGLLPATVSVNKVRFKPLTDLAFVARAVPTVLSAQMVAKAIDSTTAAAAATATSFLYTGKTPVQTGVWPEGLEMRRMAVLRGRVVNRDGVPMPGVSVRVLDHAEFGATYTRADGQYDLAVNGGGALVVKLSAPGLLPVQRQVEAASLDFNTAPDVVMLGVDTSFTDIAFGPSAPLQTHEATIQHDADGDRHALLIFQPSTQVTLDLPGSSISKSSLRVRATEYTVGPEGPAAMPGPLPADSAYAYGIGYTADEAINAGAIGVRFSQPVITYVEDLLGFPAGTIVPSGSYDEQRGVWEAGLEGRVITILGSTSGPTNLDVDGDGNADTGPALTALGITDAERTLLTTRYAPGQKLWRVPVDHFGSWDANWGFALTAGAAGPLLPGVTKNEVPDDEAITEAGGAARKAREGDRSGAVGVKVRAQSASVEIPIAGSAFRLHYDSARMSGYAAGRQLSIPLSGASEPATLKRIELEVSVAGQVFTQAIAPGTNLTASYAWDGKDAYGRSVQGRQPARVRIGYVYDGAYARTVRFGFDGNGSAITGEQMRSEVTLNRISRVTLPNAFDARRLAVGGWTLDPHHVYDPIGHVLYLSDGRQRSAEGLRQTLQTVAGGGALSGTEADGFMATEAALSIANTAGMALAPDGTIYLSEANGGPGLIRKVDASGMITTIAGQNASGGLELGDDGPATDAFLNQPQGLACGRDGSLFVVDSLNNRIRRIGADGIITTFAGGAGSFADNVPATQTALHLDEDPNGLGIATGPDGSVYVIDQINSGRVRRITPDGIITTVAGAGNVNPPNFGDGGQATAARVVGPTDVAVDVHGNLYIAAEGRVRKVTPDGVIRTVAGGAPPVGDAFGEGIAATTAYAEPRSIAPLPDGSLYFSETTSNPAPANNRVRYVDLEGNVSTIAGTAGPGFSGDNSPPRIASFDFPNTVRRSPAGELFIVDGNNNRVRAIQSTLPGFADQEIDIPSEDARQLYRFDGFGRHLKTFDTFTGAVLFAFAYEADGQLSSISDAAGNVTKVLRTPGGAPVAIVAPFGQRTALTSNASGELTSVRDPMGGTWKLEPLPTGGGLLAKVTDPLGKVATYTYESDGRLKQIAAADGATLTLARTGLPDGYSVAARNATDATSTDRTEVLDSGGELRTITDPANVVRSEEREEDGTLSSVSADGTAELHARGGDPRFGLRAPLEYTHVVVTPGAGMLVESRVRALTLADPHDPLSLSSYTETSERDGLTTSTSFEPAQRRFDVASPLGRHFIAELDMAARPVRVQVPGTVDLQLGYDRRGHLFSRTSGMGATVRAEAMTYNLAGQLATRRDALQRVTIFAYNAAGDLTQMTLPGRRVVKMGRDLLGRVNSITPPGHPAHKLAYTEFGALSTYTAPEAGGGVAQTVFSYRKDRQLSTIARPGGQTISYSYDTAGRVQTRTVAAGATTFLYDPTTGLLDTVTSPDGSVVRLSYTGRIPTGVARSGEVAGSTSRSLDHDMRTLGDVVNLADPVGISYDDDGGLIGAGELTVTRDPETGLAATATIGTLTETFQYNDFAEVKLYRVATSGGTIFEQQFTRDNLGRVTHTIETIGGTTTTYDYSYDVPGRLTGVAVNGAAAESYAYDLNGNRMSANGVSASYDAQDRLTQFGARAMTYNAAGDLQQKALPSGTLTLTCDELGNLTRAVSPAAQVDYVVDGLGQRIGRKIGGALTQGFLYDTTGRVVAELDGTSAVRSRFVHGTRSRVPDYFVRGGATYRLVADGNGSVRLVVKADDGTVVQRIDYSAFGAVTADSNPGFQPFGFAGGLYDGATGLVRLGGRDYDAELGRFTTKDPGLFASGETNLYVFTGNDPVNPGRTEDRRSFDGAGDVLEFLREAARGFRER